MIILRCCLVIAMALILGCASYGERKQLDMLEQRTGNYETALRWGRYELASAFIKSKENAHVTVNLDGLKQIKITSYKLLGRNLLANNVEAEQKVEIRFYNMDNLIERTIIDHQTWIFNYDVENWFLTSGLPDFK